MDLHDDRRKTADAVSFLSTAVNVEYGLTDRISVSGSFPFEKSSRDNFPNFTGLGDGRAGLKIGFFSESEGDPVSVSLQNELKFPLSGYETDALHGFGDGQLDLKSRLSLGKYFVNWSGYLVVEAGTTIRRDEPSNEVSVYLEVGKTVARTTTFRLFLEQTESLGGVGLESPEFFALIPTRRGPPFPHVEEDFVKFGVGIGQLVGSVDIGAFWSKSIVTHNTAVDNHIGFSLGVGF